MLADTTAVSDTSQDEINPSDKTAVSDTPEASLTWRCFVAHQRYVIHWIFQNQRSEKSGICPGLMVEVLRFRLMIVFSRRMTPRESPMEWDSYDSLPTGTGSFRYHCDCFFGSTIFKKKIKNDMSKSWKKSDVILVSVDPRYVSYPKMDWGLWGEPPDG